MPNFCGEGGIRTLGAVSRTTVFETATIDRSATSPKSAWYVYPCQGLLCGWVRGAAKVKILGELSGGWVELSGLAGIDFWGGKGKYTGLKENR